MLKSKTKGVLILIFCYAIVLAVAVSLLHIIRIYNIDYLKAGSAVIVISIFFVNVITYSIWKKYGNHGEIITKEEIANIDQEIETIEKEDKERILLLKEKHRLGKKIECSIDRQKKKNKRDVSLFTVCMFICLLICFVVIPLFTRTNEYLTALLAFVAAFLLFYGISCGIGKYLSGLYNSLIMVCFFVLPYVIIRLICQVNTHWIVTVGTIVPGLVLSATLVVLIIKRSNRNLYMAVEYIEHYNSLNRDIIKVVESEKDYNKEESITFYFGNKYAASVCNYNTGFMSVVISGVVNYKNTILNSVPVECYKIEDTFEAACEFALNKLEEFADKKEVLVVDNI